MKYSKLSLQNLLCLLIHTHRHKLANPITHLPTQLANKATR